MPGTKKTGPGGFAPTQIGNVPMKLVRFKVEPQFTGESMSETIAGLCMQNHFRFARRGASKVKNPWLIVSGANTANAGFCLGRSGIKIQPAVRPGYRR